MVINNQSKASAFVDPTQKDTDVSVADISFPFNVTVTEKHLKALEEARIFLSRNSVYNSNWLSKIKQLGFSQEIYCEENCCFMGGNNFFLWALILTVRAIFQKIPK